jgi:predicted protein tyrosine phosphatase
VAMRIAVCSIDALPRSIEQWEPDAVISVLSPSPRLQVNRLHGRRHLVLLFHDIESATIHTKTSRSARRLVGCSERHIQRFIEFIEIRPSRLLIHCVAGLSRSPSLAMLAICKIQGDVAEACIAVNRAIPNASPNRRVLHLGDDALKLNGRLIELAASTFPDRQMKHERIEFVELDFRAEDQNHSS